MTAMHSPSSPWGTLTRAEAGDGFVYHFSAMASPCEVRLDTDDAALALSAGQAVEAEALRIEGKFSRYRPDSELSRINSAEGAAIKVDTEMAALLDMAARFHELSEGFFDVTSGVLRRVWRFNGSDRIPSDAEVDNVRQLIGWGKVAWSNPYIRLPEGMEIDLGGIAKEYAVDCSMIRLQSLTDAPTLINFGGDLRVSGPQRSNRRWKVAIESVDEPGRHEARLEIASGALTTSGDARRFLLKDGVRYGHILNPVTGWPVSDAPRSVTVASRTCTEAGLLSTLAMLQGKGCEAFLEREGIAAWVIR